MNLATLSAGESICWPSDNKKSPDLLNFGIMKDIPKDFCCTESCLEFSSDHSPVILTVYSKIMIKNKPCTLCDVKEEWPYFQELFKPAELAESYRPISLLAVLSKLFEKLLLSRINIIMENHRLIPGHQFGFRSKHAITEQIHGIVKRINHDMEAGRYCSAIFLDVSLSTRFGTDNYFTKSNKDF